MKNLIVAAIAAITIPFAAHADFYNAQSGNWAVYGAEGGGTQNPACIIERTWDDGSEFQLTYDLVTNELYIWLENRQWTIRQPMNVQETLYMQAVGSNTNSGNLSYYAVTSDTIVIPNIEPNSFLESFASQNQLQIYMPYGLRDAYVDLNGTRVATNLFVECIDMGRYFNPQTGELNFYE
jgi:quinol monooxygenase YgiN